MKLALLGPAGSFSDLARKKMKLGFTPHYVSSFQEVFKAVRNGEKGLVPFFNKIIGDFPEVSRFFSQENSKVHRRFRMSVQFVLAAKEKMPFDNISRLYTSRAVYVQCRKFIRDQLGDAKINTDLDSSSSSYKKVVQLRVGEAAAIGSAAGARLYGLKILAKNIQDDPEDWTEFVLFG